MLNFLKNKEARTKSSLRQGMTVMEILVVVAVLGIIVAVALPQFSKTRELQVVKSAVSDIVSSLNKAQSQTLASVNSSSYGVHFESDKIVIFKGIIFSANDPNNEIIDIVAPANIFSVTFGGVSGNSGDVYFKRLSGVPNQFGTIIISSSSFSKIVTISVLGAVSVN